MKLLILGGTRFLGRHLAAEALQRGHEVTLFHRGISGAPLEGAESLIGDRDADLSLLQGRQWDLVIDTSAYRPSQVHAAADVLAGNTGHYTLVSSCSVYADFSKRSIGETAPVLTLEPEQLAEYDRADADDSWWAHYGALKYHCEAALNERMPGRALIIRPGLIVGPYDSSDRFAYWVRRLAQGGEVLAPGRPERPIQVIDARDLAAWMLEMSEAARTGTFNAAGPDRLLSMQELLETCRRAVGVDARCTWLCDAFLEEQGAGPWQELPLWIPETHSGEGPDMTGFLSLNNERALRAGLSFRSLEATVQDTWRWMQTDPPEVLGSLTLERERELLELWQQCER